MHIQNIKRPNEINFLYKLPALQNIIFIVPPFRELVEYVLISTSKLIQKLLYEFHHGTHGAPFSGRWLEKIYTYYKLLLHLNKKVIAIIYHHHRRTLLSIIQNHCSRSLVVSEQGSVSGSGCPCVRPRLTLEPAQHRSCGGILSQPIAIEVQKCHRLHRTIEVLFEKLCLLWHLNPRLWPTL